MTAPTKPARQTGQNHRLSVLGAHDMRREVNECQTAAHRTCTESVEFLAEWEYPGKRRGHDGMRMVPGKKTICRTHAHAFAERYSIPMPEE